MSNIPAPPSTLSQDPTLSSASSANLAPRAKPYSQIIAYGSQEIVDSVIQAAKFAYDSGGTLWNLHLPSGPADPRTTEQQRETNKLIRKFIDEGSAWVSEADKRTYTRQVWQAGDIALPHGVAIHSIDTTQGSFRALNMFCSPPEAFGNAKTSLYHLDTGTIEDVDGYPQVSS